MAVLPAVLSIGGSILGAFGAVQQGNAQAQSANYNAQVAANNAIIAKQNATYSAGAASSNNTQEGLKVRQQDANVRAGLAANGIEADSGSAGAVQAGQHEIGALDVATVANRGAQAVYGYQTQASGYEAQAGLNKMQAGNDAAAGYLKAGGSLLSGAPTLASGASSAFKWMGGNPSVSGGIDDPALGSNSPNNYVP